jgi:hypothetical protein
MGGWQGAPIKPCPIHDEPEPPAAQAEPHDATLNGIRYKWDELTTKVAKQAEQIAALQADLDRLHGHIFSRRDWTAMNARIVHQTERITALEAQNRALREAALAAIAYDSAIHRRGFMGDTTSESGEREHYATGDDLDELYDDWITKSRAALATPGIAPATTTED